MREQRQSFERSAELAAKERKAERRWRNLFQAMFFGAPVLLGLVLPVLPELHRLSLGPFGNVVGVVRIEGPIGATERASAENIIPILEKAFGNPNVKGVVLHIDSPGGAPVEAERISTAINGLKAKHRKEVVAVINNLGERCLHGRAERGQDHRREVLVRRIDRRNHGPVAVGQGHRQVDVAQRVYASGKLKAFLNPFTPVSPGGRPEGPATRRSNGGFFPGRGEGPPGQAPEVGCRLRHW